LGHKVAERVLLFRIASSLESQKAGRKWRFWRRISESCFARTASATTYKPLISTGPCAGVNKQHPNGMTRKDVKGEGMLGRLAAHAHRLRILIEAPWWSLG
jgi:hypothetical protein